MKSIQGSLGVLVVLAVAALAGCNHDDECDSGGCGSVQASSGASGVGGGSESVNVTGDEPGQACVISSDLCSWRPITASNDEAALSAGCTSDGGQVAADCPRQDLGGCCATHTGIECHYNVADSSDDKVQCEGLRGTWRSTPP